ncbi:hypothetical protein [Streptomyces sp. NPDC001774]
MGADYESARVSLYRRIDMHYTLSKRITQSESLIIGEVAEDLNRLPAGYSLSYYKTDYALQVLKRIQRNRVPGPAAEEFLNEAAEEFDWLSGRPAGTEILFRYRAMLASELDTLMHKDTRLVKG